MENVPVEEYSSLAEDIHVKNPLIPMNKNSYTEIG